MPIPARLNLIQVTRARARLRRGSMIPLMAGAIIILIVAAAFSVDTAYIQLARTEMRSAVDAAARGAGQVLASGGSDSTARQTAKDVALLNKVAGLRNSIDNAAYEAARRGVVPGATANDCVNTVVSMLTAVGARNTSVTVTPNPIVDSTTQVSVSISTPISSNSWGPARFLGGVTLRSISTKSREFVGQLVPTSVP